MISNNYNPGVKNMPNHPSGWSQIAFSVCVAAQGHREQQLNLSLLSIGKSTPDTKRLSPTLPSDPPVLSLPDSQRNSLEGIGENGERGRGGEVVCAKVMSPSHLGINLRRQRRAGKREGGLPWAQLERDGAEWPAAWQMGWISTMGRV